MLFLLSSTLLGFGSCRCCDTHGLRFCLEGVIVFAEGFPLGKIQFKFRSEVGKVGFVGFVWVAVVLWSYFCSVP